MLDSTSYSEKETLRMVFANKHDLIYGRFPCVENIRLCYLVLDLRS